MSGDNYVISQALSSDASEYNIADSYFINCPDSNQGQYSASQVRINTIQLTSCQDFFNAKGSSIFIPYQVTVSSTQNLSNAEYMLTLKNSCFDIVNSVSCRLNNVQVLTPTENSHVVYNWRLLSETSTAALPVLADQLIFSKNDGQCTYQAAASSRGIGISDNRIVDYEFDNASDKVIYSGTNIVAGHKKGGVNHGYVERATVTGYNPLSTQNTLFTTLANCVNKRKSHYESSTAQLKYFNMLIELPLAQFSSFFEHLPLTRGLNLEFIIGVHAATTVIQTTYHAAAANVSPVTTDFNLTSCVPSFDYNPIMIGDDRVVQVAAADATITITASVGSAAGKVSPFGAQCFLRANMLKLSPEFESIYTSSFSKMGRQIIYDSFLLNTFYSQSSNINLMINNSVNKLRGLLVKTVLARTVNMLANPQTVGAGKSTNLSPFTSSHCMPNCSYTQCQIFVGGKPLYAIAQDYTYEMYKDQITKLTLNSGLTREIGSGLISQSDFDSGMYGYLYFDLTRLRSDLAQWMLPKSLELRAVLNIKSGTLVDIQTFTFQEESINIDPSTSSIITV